MRGGTMVRTEGEEHPGRPARKRLAGRRACVVDKEASGARNRCKSIEDNMKKDTSHMGTVKAGGEEKPPKRKKSGGKTPESNNTVTTRRGGGSKRSSRCGLREQKDKSVVGGNERKGGRRNLGTERKSQCNHEVASGSVDEDLEDNNEDHLDFSAIEKKIFEGLSVMKNSDRTRPGVSLTKGKTKRQVTTSSPSLSEKNNVRSDKEHNKNNNVNKFSRVSKPSSNKNKVKSSRNNDDNRRKKHCADNDKKRSNKKKSAAASDSDVSDWEEVDEMEGIDEIKELLSESHVTKTKHEGVQIELDAPDVLWGIRRRKKRNEEEMIEDYLRKSVNRSIKEVHENMHKAHLLCLFAHGRHVNMTLNSDTLLAAALSIITDKNAYPPKRLDLKYLEKFVNWFSKKIAVKPEDMEEDYWSHSQKDILVKRFETKQVCSNREFVIMFVIMCRALGMNVRLVLSLQPMSWKPSAERLIKPPKKTEKKPNIFSEPCSQTPESTLNKKNNKEEKDKLSRKMLSSDSDVDVKGKRGSKIKNSKGKEKKIKKRKSLSGGGDDDDDDSDFDLTPVKLKRGPQSVSTQRQRSDKRKSSEGSGSTDKRKENENDGKVEGKRKKNEPLMEWAEVYVEEEEKWVCVDVTRRKIHCTAEIGARMPATSAYITAYNANLTVKDVSKRYVPSWLSNENKLRCCSKWWEKVLRSFKGQRTRLDKEEDKEMDLNLKEQPLPKSIGEYKNHPLYALQRHLLKFEAIYPPDVSPVGFIKSEPVYPRDSIYNLHSRDTWMKEAKTVIVGEEPYKVVKARPKWDKLTCKVIKDLPLELYGEWQVEDYEPPVASGGKVPRNEYGNVELFKPTMLPKGCVHIPIGGLNRLARKLNIDCAPAMVGFDFHSGWTHPVYDGYVVCEEFKDILMDAWNQEQIEQAKRAEEKRQKRIYDNWKKLIQGMLVKERVREMYGNVAPSDEEEDQKETETAKKTSEAKEKDTPRRKIKQEDIDAVRPPLITHQVRNLNIDLSSNVVEMAKKSRKRTMKTKNSIKRVVSKKGKTENTTGKDVKTEQVEEDNEESESDVEEKKAKIRAILQWGNKTVTANPDLSDDSDEERQSRPSSSHVGVPFSDPFYTVGEKQGQVKNKSGKGRKKSQAQEPSDCEEHVTSRSTSRSTTPEPDLGKAGCRRLSRRSAKQKIKTYKESDGENEGYISIDESDCEDKTYNPLKEKKAATHVLNLSEESNSD